MTAAYWEPIARRRFDPGDQDAFARLSGDHNPLHMDPLAARRLIFGGPVVHGVHTLLWALDAVAGPPRVSIAKLRVEFLAPILVGAEVTLVVKMPASEIYKLKITTEDDKLAVIIDVTWVADDNDDRDLGAGPKPVCPKSETPRILNPEDAVDKSGCLDLHLDPDLAGDLFPHLTKALDPTLLAAVLATSRIVGMECPGLRSIFSGMVFDAAVIPVGNPILDYRVTRLRTHLSLADIDISGGGLKGRIRALFRPPPTIQPTMSKLSEIVNNREFAGQRALIIGASRGLGEVTAKLMAAGGADVRLTYHTGQDDAERVRNEITASGGQAECFAFDVLSPASNLAKQLGDGRQVTMLGYFATPHIGAGLQDGFSDTVFQRLKRTYVDGFRATMMAVREGSNGRELNVLYPSSIYVGDTPADMKEYAAAKEAGERVCAELATEIGFKFVAPRFPRLATDQTARLLSKKDPDASTFVLDALKQLFDTDS